MTKLLELLFLGNIKGFGKAKINKHLKKVEAAENIDQLTSDIQAEIRIPVEDIETAKDKAKQDFEKLTQQKDLKIITVFDVEYPRGFDSLGMKKPAILYAKGDITVLNRPGISVVGSRHPSSWTMRFGENISKQIGLRTKRTIVSGLAIGCDRLAHEGALLAGCPTIAVLPSGVNNIIPASHKELANEIVKKGGCLISEYQPDTKAFNASYVDRDRLIAAMTDITFVIECLETGGTMHTVNAAYKMKRRLACYYPKESDFFSRKALEKDYLGNKKIIDEMGATVVSDENELEKVLGPAEKIGEENDDKNDIEPYQITLSGYMEGVN